METLDLRPSPIAGTWYEGNPKALAARIDEYLDHVKLPRINGSIIAVIAPHAGHRYSGQVAAHAFAAIRGYQPDLVAVISPHHNITTYPLLTTSHHAYSTPLGNIEVDLEALSELNAALNIPVTPIAKDKEHSLEIELPFLQRVLKSPFKLLPVMVRAQEPEIAKQLGRALAGVLKDKNTLMVASTDLSHFYDSKTAGIFDHEMLKRFESFDPDSIFEAEVSGKGFACGHAAVASVFWASRILGAKTVKVVNYATSGDVTGDYSSVVGYGAAVVLKPL
jgi:AmmeMemoRadiSam system protein B